MIMDTTSSGSNTAQQQQSPAYALMKRGKRGAAALIAADCCNVAATLQQQQDDGGGGDAAAAASALSRCKLLDNMLDVLLNPYDAIGEWNNLDWLRWLMAGGKTLDEFSSAVKDYDYGTCCGLVWTANYVAYRCRTCSISPCMSLCGDCFKRGDHTGHDFNMFRSQAGGACDCGDTSVMKPDGFCRKHSSTNNIDGSSNNSDCKQPPADLLRVAERIMPRLLLRLVQYLRENSKHADTRTNSNLPLGGAAGMTNQQQQNLLLDDLDPFLGMLHDLSHLGAAMRRVMTVSLTNEKIYRWACDYYSSNSGNIVSNDSSQQPQQQQQTIYTMYTDKVRRYYAEAIHQYTTSSSSSSNRRRRHSNTTSMSSGDIIVNNSLSSSEDDDNEEFGPDEWLGDGQNISSRKNRLNHSSFLQEIVFWTVRYEFPQKMVCLLLNMLPDAAYKEALTEAFVMHYGCVARVLATTRDSDTLSNHIVHISVQLFSNEALATRMVDKLGLLRVMVSSLRRMMTKILIPSTLHDPSKNRHRVVDCSKAVMREHCYWPLVSDLNNVLSHRPIAVKFMCDDRLLDSWFSYLSMFQGMNVNCRELGHHVEFEPNTYYAAFSAELEASAYPMWAMLSHLTSTDTWPLASRVLRSCLQRLRKWLVDVGYYNHQDNGSASLSSNVESHDINCRSISSIIQRPDDRHQFTFHLPLHRYFAVFLCQAVRAQGARIEDIIPHITNDTFDRDALLLAIASHPVRAQAAFYEIMQGAWVRNGLQIKGQAMTYIQSNFCISMVDADIYLLQFCLSELSDPNIFMSLILEKFKVNDWMRVIKHGGLPQVMDSVEYDAAPSMESLLVFLATLVGVRTNLCSDEDYDYCQSQLEMVTLLCVSDKTHSQLMELMPERCGGGTQNTTATPVPSGNSASQSRPLSDQESSACSRDFETVLQAVAEYKRPQFEASGNMQQGLYVPLAHVWRHLYDPVHVLLRAVHRRDFQSSMDRYTAFMRSIGLLRQNQTPWPPYRTPQKHHPAYQDPRRALLTKLFHAVAWHCLYRSAVYRDVSEHTLSLLVYLLDQAWICYNDFSNSTNINTNQSNRYQQQQPMDTDPPINTQFSSPSATAMVSNECLLENSTNDNLCPKRRIKITATDINNSCDTNKDQDATLLLLDRWYGHDDLAENLCVTITQIELPPPSFHNYQDAATEDTTTSNTLNTTGATAMASNLFDYFTSSVAAAAAAATAASSSSSTGSNNVETDNSHLPFTSVPSLAVIAGMVGNEMPTVSSFSSQQSNTEPPTRPAFYSLNAAVASTSSTMDSALNRVKQRLQFLRPPPPKSVTPLQKQQSSSSSLEQQIVSDVDSSPLSQLDYTSNETGIVGELAGQQQQPEKNDNETFLAAATEEQNSSLVSVNESIISLLLRLHSHLSGTPDSYRPPSSTSASMSDLIDGTTDNFVSTPANNHNQREVLPCGDGAYYVGRLLDRIAKGSKLCYDCIVRTRLALWPKAVVMRETATREDEERERRERKRRARDKQRRMMEEMARAQRAFIESARRSGDLDSNDTPSQSQTQSQPSSATSTISSSTITMNMECDEPAPVIDTPTVANTSSGATSLLSNTVVIDVDENSSSSNSTSTKESAGFRSFHQQETTPTVDCVICNQTVVVQTEQQRRDPVGLVILVQGTNILAHRRKIILPATPQNQQNVSSSTDTSHLQKQQHQIGITATSDPNSSLENHENQHLDDEEQNYYLYWPALPPSQIIQHQQSTADENHDLQQHHQSALTVDDEGDNTTTYAAHADCRRQVMNHYFTNLDLADLKIGATTTTAGPTINIGNVHVQTCGHHLHLRCWRSYLASLRGAQRFASDRGEYSCPLCRQLANSVMPLMPEVIGEHNQLHRRNHHTTTINNTATNTIAMSDAMNKLTELIEYQHKQLISSVHAPPSNVCDLTSVSVATTLLTSSDHLTVHHHRQNQQQQNIHHHHYHDGGYQPDQHVDGESIENNGGRERMSKEYEEDPLLDAVNKCVDDMITTTTSVAATTATSPNAAAQHQQLVTWYRVVSIAWTNLQVELVQRNNTLIEQQGISPLNRGNNSCRSQSSTSGAVADSSGCNSYYNMLPKRNCMTPLLRVLNVRARSLMMKHHQRMTNYNPLCDIWYKLIGRLPQEHCNNTTNPPLLLRDPCSVLIQLLLLLPPLERDLFDTLVKLIYNMQIYAAALKVAVTWNRNINPHHRNNQSKTVMNEDIIADSGCTRMDLGCTSDIPSSSMDLSGSGNIPLLSTTPSFSQAIALAKTTALLEDDNDAVGFDANTMVNNEDEFIMYHDDHQDDNDGQTFTTSDSGNEDSKINIAITTLEDINEEDMLSLESYGRRCSLPFLRFAALLKKYTNDEDNTDQDDYHHDLITSSLPQSSHRQNNSVHWNAEQHKQQEQILDIRTRNYHHKQPSLTVEYNDDDLKKNSPFCRQNHCLRHWSRDDYEFLTLTRYLKLLNCNKSYHCTRHENYDEEYEDCCERSEINDCNYKINDDYHDSKNKCNFIPPSAMEAVNWPEQWCNTENSCDSDDASTTIARTWLLSIRDSLTIKTTATTSSGGTASTPITVITTTASPVIKAMPETDGTNVVVLRAARQLFAVDWGNDGISTNNMLPSINWTGPRLLRLPHLYDDVFQYYHGRSCRRCHGVPRETSVCLVCGTVVCLKENCCKTNNTCEAVQHSIDCGGGTAMFLVVTSSSVVVVRGKRACLWGSVYLDAFGEEDRELKRGKPLFLSAERYRLLERQWLAHRFDHTNKKWVWHRDAL